MRDLIREAGAVKDDSPLNGHHLRHTTLSYVKIFIPRFFREHRQRARHTDHKAFDKYRLGIGKETEAHLKNHAGTIANITDTTTFLML